MSDHQLQRIAEAAALGVSILSAYVMLRVVLGPDAMVRVRMKTYRAVSRTAKQGSDVLLVVASRADTAYHKCRNVAV